MDAYPENQHPLSGAYVHVFGANDMLSSKNNRNGAFVLRRYIKWFTAGTPTGGLES